MRLTFLGANRQVTGSCYLLETRPDGGGARVLIDCGMFQERHFQYRNWKPFPFNPEQLDAMLLTHAHLDHVGLIPKLVAEGFRSPIYTTAPTIELARLVMLDSAKIQAEDLAYKSHRHRREGRSDRWPAQPLYTEEDAEAAVKLMRPISYGETVKVAHGVSAVFRDAGHILGAASIQITADPPDHSGTRRLVMSGDVGRWNQPLIHDPTLFNAADYVVMESTYGDRDHPDEDPEVPLARIVHDTLSRGGKLVIPTFAIERAQELIWHFGKLQRDHVIPNVPVYLDSPMAADVTEIFIKYRSWFDGAAQEMIHEGGRPLHPPSLHMLKSVQESMQLNGIAAPVIIMAPSGMCTGGRIKHHLSHHIGDPRSTVLFVGYQGEGTLGRQILDGASEVRIHGRPTPVRAHVEQIAGFSAHAGRSNLLRWLGGFKQPPRTLFLTHGEERVSMSLAEEIRRDRGWNVEVPEYHHHAEI